MTEEVLLTISLDGFSYLGPLWLWARSRYGYRSAVPCAGRRVARCASWWRGLGYQSKKLVCCLSGVLIQKEIRNSCLVFRWESAMRNKKQLKVPWNSGISGDARAADGLLSPQMKIMLINILQNWLQLNICFLWAYDYQLIWKMNFGNIWIDLFLWNSILEI